MTQPTYGLPNGTEIRVTMEGWAARLKVTAGALGIVDVYKPSGEWLSRVTWTPLTGFMAYALYSYPAWEPVGERLSAALAVAFHHHVTRLNARPPRQSRRGRTPAILQQPTVIGDTA